MKESVRTRYPFAKQVWAIYKHGHRYVMEIRTNQGTVLLLNACTTSLTSELDGWSLVCIAYEQTLLWRYREGQSRQPRVSLPHGIALPSCPAIVTERSCQAILKVLERGGGATSGQDDVEIVENSLNNCAYFCEKFRQNEWKVIGGFPVLFSLYPGIPHEIFLKFVSINIPRSRDVEHASSEIRESFISLQHYIVAFNQAVDGFLHDSDLMDVFTALKTACFCLRLNEGRLVEMAGEFMAALVSCLLEERGKPRSFSSEGMNSDDWLFIAVAIFGDEVLNPECGSGPCHSANSMSGRIPWDAIMARRFVATERQTREAVLRQFRDNWNKFQNLIHEKAKKRTWRFKESFTQHSFQVIREPIFD
jgi:hypothetical protein